MYNTAANLFLRAFNRKLLKLHAYEGAPTIRERTRQLHPTQVSTWKRQAIEGMAGVFSDKVKKAENKDGEIKELHAKIGQLAVENDFLSQGLKR